MSTLRVELFIKFHFRLLMSTVTHPFDHYSFTAKLWFQSCKSMGKVTSKMGISQIPIDSFSKPPGGGRMAMQTRIVMIRHHSILKFFQIDIAGRLRMTSSARYF